jgi:hypothetical protein
MEPQTTGTNPKGHQPSQGRWDLFPSLGCEGRFANHFAGIPEEFLWTDDLGEFSSIGFAIDHLEF